MTAVPPYDLNRYRWVRIHECGHALSTVPLGMYPPHEIRASPHGGVVKTWPINRRAKERMTQEQVNEYYWNEAVNYLAGDAAAREFDAPHGTAGSQADRDAARACLASMRPPGTFAAAKRRAEEIAHEYRGAILALCDELARNNDLLQGEEVIKAALSAAVAAGRQPPRQIPGVSRAEFLALLRGDDDVDMPDSVR